MPEGHTLHRYARHHHRWLAGTTVHSSSPQGRFTGATDLDGATLLRVEAWGKHIVYTFDLDWAPHVHIHLGLFGRFRPRKMPFPEPRGAVRWRLLGPARGFDLSGPTRCARLEPHMLAELTRRLGPDPLRKDADPQRFLDGLKRRRKSIAGALMDQSLIAGIGNVYRAEILHIHRLDPYRPANDLTEEEAMAIWRTTAKALDVGVRLGRIVTTDLDRPREVPRTRKVWVYKRPICTACHTRVQVDMLEGRKLYWCPSCQG
ncbi:MAG: Fpg/Nei family DNA glycosylase [Myxococcota bacterium]